MNNAQVPLEHVLHQVVIILPHLTQGGPFDCAQFDVCNCFEDVLLKVVEDGKEYCQIAQEDVVENVEERLKKTSLSCDWMDDEAHVFG